jgi:hypothetical protein
MSFTEVLNELPALNVEQRRLLINGALELEELPLSAEDEASIEKRLAAHCQNPASSVSLAEIEARLQDRFPR